MFSSAPTFTSVQAAQATLRSRLPGGPARSVRPFKIVIRSCRMPANPRSASPRRRGLQGSGRTGRARRRRSAGTTSCLNGGSTAVRVGLAPVRSADQATRPAVVVPAGAAGGGRGQGAGRQDAVQPGPGVTS